MLRKRAKPENEYRKKNASNKGRRALCFLSSRPPNHHLQLPIFLTSNLRSVTSQDQKKKGQKHMSNENEYRRIETAANTEKKRENQDQSPKQRQHPARSSSV